MLRNELPVPMSLPPPATGAPTAAPPPALELTLALAATLNDGLALAAAATPALALALALDPLLLDAVGVLEDEGDADAPVARPDSDSRRPLPLRGPPKAVVGSVRHESAVGA
jgi:hypothetical protein